MAGASVETRGVTRRFKLGSEIVVAVNNVSLEISSGEFVALIGRSGSGKRRVSVGARRCLTVRQDFKDRYVRRRTQYKL